MQLLLMHNLRSFVYFQIITVYFLDTLVTLFLLTCSCLVIVQSQNVTDVTDSLANTRDKKGIFVSFQPYLNIFVAVIAISYCLITMTNHLFHSFVGLPSREVSGKYWTKLKRKLQYLKEEINNLKK